MAKANSKKGGGIKITKDSSDADRQAAFEAVAAKKVSTLLKAMKGLTGMLTGSKYRYKPEHTQKIKEALASGSASLTAALDGKRVPNADFSF